MWRKNTLAVIPSPMFIKRFFLWTTLATNTDGGRKEKNPQVSFSCPRLSSAYFPWLPFQRVWASCACESMFSRLDSFHVLLWWIGISGSVCMWYQNKSFYHQFEIMVRLRWAFNIFTRRSYTLLVIIFRDCKSRYIPRSKLSRERPILLSLF